MTLTTIISGGQTGADRASLDWAIKNNISHGGWCPKGRIALDGRLDSKYDLLETPSAGYPQRTAWNVRDSDATVIFTLAPVLSGGSAKTLDLAGKAGKPCLHLYPGLTTAPAIRLKEFIDKYRVVRLNCAGSRESKEPGIYAWVMATFDGLYPLLSL